MAGSCQIVEDLSSKFSMLIYDSTSLNNNNEASSVILLANDWDIFSDCDDFSEDDLQNEDLFYSIHLGNCKTDDFLSCKFCLKENGSSHIKELIGNEIAHVDECNYSKIMSKKKVRQKRRFSSISSEKLIDLNLDLRSIETNQGQNSICVVTTDDLDTTINDVPLKDDLILQSTEKRRRLSVPHTKGGMKTPLNYKPRQTRKLFIDKKSCDYSITKLNIQDEKVNPSKSVNKNQNNSVDLPKRNDKPKNTFPVCKTKVKRNPMLEDDVPLLHIKTTVSTKSQYEDNVSKTEPTAHRLIKLKTSPIKTLRISQTSESFPEGEQTSLLPLNQIPYSKIVSHLVTASNFKFLGCLGGSFNALLLNKPTNRSFDQNNYDILEYLSISTNLSILKASHKLLSSVQADVSKLDDADLKSSIKALERVLDIVNQFQMHLRTSVDEQRLANVTALLSNIELSKFIKTFFKWKTRHNTQVSMDESLLLQNIKKYQLHTTLHEESKADEREHTQKSVQQKNNIPNKEPKNASKLSKISADDLEKLVNNFSCFEEAVQREIRKYIYCLKESNPHFALCMLQRIDGIH